MGVGWCANSKGTPFYCSLQAEDTSSSYKKCTPADEADQEALAREKDIIQGFVLEARHNSVCHMLVTLPFTLTLTLLPHIVEASAWYAWGTWIAVLVTRTAHQLYTSNQNSKKFLGWMQEHERLTQRTYLKPCKAFVLGESVMPGLSCVPLYILGVIFGVPYSLNLDMDFATAVNALFMESIVHNSWVESWLKIPLIGKYIGVIWMSQAMIVCCAFAMFMQFWQCRSIHHKCMEETDKWPIATDQSTHACSLRFQTWQLLGAYYDVSGHLHDGNMCQEVCKCLTDSWNEAEKDVGSRKVHFPPGRGVKFRQHIAYNCAPQLWLQVSYVSHAYSIRHLRVVITAMVGLFISLLVMCLELCRSIKRIWQLWTVMLNKTFEVALNAIVVFLLVACAIRIFGIWFCKEHVFNLTSGCCSDCKPHFGRPS